MTTFSEIAARYEKNSIVQMSASDQLFDLVRIRENDDVLDIGCGTGHLTKKIRELTRGTVVGADSSEGMIAKAKRDYSSLRISFEECGADRLPYTESFDVIFCNSAFQWFRNSEAVLESCFESLRSGGRMGIQAPARRIYSPNFVEAVKSAETDPRINDLFSTWETPWLFLDTAEEYEALFENVGFEVIHASIDKVVTFHTPEEVYNIFDSGAAAGYLNQEFYRTPISDEYVDAFRSKIREAFRTQAN